MTADEHGFPKYEIWQRIHRTLLAAMILGDTDPPLPYVPPPITIRLLPWMRWSETLTWARERGLDHLVQLQPDEYDTQPSSELYEE
jgi:hypothetical protein